MKIPQKFLLFLFCVTAIFITVHITNSHEVNIPYTSSGNATVFNGQINTRRNITEVDATEDRIYFLFSSIGLVEAYNWDGEYQFSVAVYFNPEGHGRCDIRCEDNLLYIQDFDHNVIVMKEQEILKKVEHSQSSYTIPWFNESSHKVSQKGKNLIDSHGNFIMKLPGIGDTESYWRSILRIISMLIISIICILANRGRRFKTT